MTTKTTLESARRFDSGRSHLPKPSGLRSFEICARCADSFHRQVKAIDIRGKKFVSVRDRVTLICAI